jgi:hypothetical protein
MVKRYIFFPSFSTKILFLIDSIHVIIKKKYINTKSEIPYQGECHGKKTHMFYYRIHHVHE